MPASPLSGRVALVTGANHGIGAATAVALASLGATVGITYLRPAPAYAGAGRRSAAYVEQRRRDAADVTAAVAAARSTCIAMEADLSDASVPAAVFDQIESTLGPVSILVNNASGWLKDTFAPETGDPFDRHTEFLNAATVDAQLLVDALGGALLIAEMARRHRARRSTWGRIVSLTSEGPKAFRARCRTAQRRPPSRTTR